MSFPPGTSIINREGKECGTVKNAAKWAALWALLVLLPAGCAGGEADSSQPRQLGEEVSTAWFTFSVEEATCTQEYQGYSAQQGETLVVVELSLRSRYDQAIPMFDTDFQLSWQGMEPQDQRCMPVEHYCQEQLPTEYELQPRETLDGVAVYEIPEEARDLVLTFQEVFDDGTQEGKLGETYTVDLSQAQ